MRNDDERSVYTLMVFLNDDYEGGSTNFFPRNSIGKPYSARISQQVLAILSLFIFFLMSRR